LPTGHRLLGNTGSHPYDCIHMPPLHTTKNEKKWPIIRQRPRIVKSDKSDTYTGPLSIEVGQSIRIQLH
jgi:hypothetical protein